MIFADLTKSDITERQWELLKQSEINLERVSVSDPSHSAFEEVDGVLVDTPRSRISSRCLR